MTIFTLDWETRSPVDLSKCGAYRYAEEADIILAAIAKDDQPVLLWDRFATDEANAPALALLREAAQPGSIIYAHNVGFEVAIATYQWRKTFGFDPPPLENWRCTAALCRMAAIPSSLEKSAEFLKLPVLKDTAGKALIQKFCIPQKDGVWIEPDHDKPMTIAGEKMSAAKAWEMFRQYAIRDVETERELEKRLKSLELKGWLLEAFQLDIRMNLRGVPVNLSGVAHAQKIVDEYNEEVGAKFREITGLNAGQTAKVLAWMQERGYPGKNMQVGTVAAVLGEAVDEEDEPAEVEGSPAAMTPEALEALRLKSLLGYAALKKLPTMERAACSDGRVRGMFSWWGAVRTGRYSSKLLQLQNFKRSTDISEHCYRAICEGGYNAEDVGLLFGPPLEMLATAIRHFIDPGPGRQFIDCDYSQIEARVLPWLAGDQVMLQAFREGKDLYKITVARTLGIAYDEVTKPNRQLGKVIVLGCQFGGGLDAMHMACAAYNITLPDKEKRRIVKAWRQANKEITAMWKLMQDAAVEAVLNPGTWVRVNDKCRFGVTGKLGYRVLVMELPSKRHLQYPYPEVKKIYKIRRPKKRKAPLTDAEEDIEEDGMEWVDIPKHQAVDANGDTYDGVWETYELSYFGQFRGSQQWGRVRTWGSRLAENITQAVAGDFLTLGAIEAEKRGYEQVLTVHDQLLTEYHPERGNSVEGLVGALCTLPKWAPDFPLDAVGNLADFYTKD